jgi:hypothetical protein
MRYKFGAKNYNIAIPPSICQGVMAISRGEWLWGKNGSMTPDQTKNYNGIENGTTTRPNSEFFFFK